MIKIIKNKIIIINKKLLKIISEIKLLIIFINKIIYLQNFKWVFI